MGATSMLHVRIDKTLKSEATAALEAMGLSASDAVRMLFKRIVAEQAFPLELKVPNGETRAAMEESRAMMDARRRRGQASTSE
ncbi:MAG TPA: type II toxin-antitoxin system RelB/DinJ family antitoxin [Caulobacteraceae bacterium]